MQLMNNDAVFNERVLMFRFGTKFLYNDPACSDEELEDRCSKYEKGTRLISPSTKRWSTKLAAFDYFMKFKAELHLLNNPPASLVDFRRTCVRDDNAMSDFLGEFFEITGKELHYMQFDEINEYIFVAKSMVRIDDRDILKSKKLRMSNVRDYLCQNSIRVHKQKRVPGEKKAR